MEHGRRTLLSKLLIDCAEPKYDSTPTSDDPALLYAEHFEDGRFFNPWGPFKPNWKDVFRAFVLTRNPYDLDRPVKVESKLREGLPKGDGPCVTWAGHATFAIQEGRDVVLTDPHFGPRAAVAPRRKPPGFPVEAVPSEALAVVSHSHYDHLDDYTVRRLPDTIRWFVPPGLGKWFRARGREATELDWWRSVKSGRWTITSLPTQHWTRRMGQPANITLWCSWLLDSGRRRYLFVGDSGYFHGFKEFGRRFSPIDVAILPIGAYAPRWFLRYQHMNPKEAWKAFQDLGARYMLPSHWGVFKLTHEPIDQPIRDFREILAAADGDRARAAILAIGECWQIPETES